MPTKPVLTAAELTALTEQHRPVVRLNPDPKRLGGVKSFIGCSCGKNPKRMPQGASVMANAYMAHVRALGLSITNVSHAVYDEGYAAAGLTWNQWYDMKTGCDPFTGQPN